jgi:hypothetical protein
MLFYYLSLYSFGSDCKSVKSVYNIVILNCASINYMKNAPLATSLFVVNLSVITMIFYDCLVYVMIYTWTKKGAMHSPVFSD